MQPSKVSKDQHNIYSSEWIKFRTELKSLLALLLYIKLYIKNLLFNKIKLCNPS